MNPERWQQITDIFENALACDASLRPAFVAEACADDPDLRLEVEKMLAAHTEAGDFISSHVMKNAAEMFSEDEPVSLKAGYTLNHYRIIKQIGEGGMGEVYLAEDTKLGRNVALKTLSPKTMRNADLVRRFEQEARAASRLNHPNIAHIYEVGFENGINFMVMEFVEGSSLRDKISNRPLPLTETLNLGMQIADALDEAHTGGIIHRDIKAENVMMTSRGRVKVLDFGLAKIAKNIESEESTALKTKSGVIMGTVAYMSPEQAMGRETDARTDIWSFGVLLYEMVTGRLPFQAENLTATIDQILHSQPEAIARFNYEVPPELEVIIKKTLRKKPEERYQSARDLLVDLENLKRELDSKEHSSSPNRQPAGKENSTEDANKTLVLRNTTAAPEAHRTSSAEYLVGEIKRHKKMAVAAVLGLFLVIGGITFAYYKFGGQPAARTNKALKIDRLTGNGRVVATAVSPDGKNIIYTVNDGKGESLWVRQVAASNDIQIIPAAEDAYYTSLSFTPDSQFINFVKREYEKNLPWHLYQMPVLGGPQKKLLSEMEGGIGYSPDGKQIAFIRTEYPTGEESSLMLANADGTGERILVTVKTPHRFLTRTASPAWSPDGKSIVCIIAGVDQSGNRDGNLVEINAADGSRKLLAGKEWGKEWSFIDHFAWLNDQSGVIVVGLEKSPVRLINQIWHVSYPGGEVRKITSDFNHYMSLSLTADSNALATVQENLISNLWVVPVGDSSQAVQVKAGGNNQEGMTGLSWTPDGRIVYYSAASGGGDIWIMNGDGSNPKQLTFEMGVNIHPRVTPDGRFIVFASIRNGNPNIWRINLDGSDPKQLTSGNFDWGPSVSPDSQWIFYTSERNADPFVWKVPIEGGEPVRVIETFAQNPELSPDGKWISCAYREGNNSTWRYAVVPVEGGPPVKVFDLLGKTGPFLRWAGDGRSLYYTRDAQGGAANIWSYSVESGETKQVTDFKTDSIFYFALSADGKQFLLSRGPAVTDAVLIKDFR